MFTKLVLADTRPGRADSYKYSHYGDPAITGKAWIHPEVIEVWVKIAPAITDLRTYGHFTVPTKGKIRLQILSLNVSVRNKPQFAVNLLAQ